MANISKLNSDQISEMRRLYSEGASMSSLAKRYNVSITTISNKVKVKDEPNLPTPTYQQLVDAEVEAVQEAVRKKKEPPKRRIVGVNV